MHRVTAVSLAALAVALVACGGGSAGPAGPTLLTLTAVEPIVGTTAGGTKVVLRGSAFLEIEGRIAAIWFGLENPAPSWTVVSDTVIEVVTPPGMVGIVTIRILDGKQETMRSGGFRYVAALLWAADGGDPDAANLHYVDLDAAQTGLVGPLGHAIAGLALSPDGDLFGVEDGGLHRLMRIDLGSGAATPIGLLEDQGGGPSYDVRDITFAGDRLIGRTSAGEMVEIDSTYGWVTVLQDLTPLVFGDGIAASAPDRVHLAPFAQSDTLFEWDPVGLSTTAGPAVTVPGGIEGTVDSLAFDGGMLYALDADLSSTLPARLLRIDPATGQTTVVLELSPRGRAVASDD
jgi:hypothetical protein